MQPRHYQPADAPAIDAILNGTGHVLLDRDRLVCMGPTGAPTNLLVWRPGCIVHGLYLSHSLGQRSRADSLVQFGLRDSISRPFSLYEAVFVTEGDIMAEYVKGKGAVEEVGKRVFTLRIR